jgi:hypothetical protein
MNLVFNLMRFITPSIDMNTLLICLIFNYFSIFVKGAFISPH